MSEGQTIKDAGYEGFCLGVDVVLQALKLDNVPEEMLEVLDGHYQWEASHAPERRPRD